MKFALNGALIIGTLDGANIEIREEVGDENMFIFGLRTEEIRAMRQQASYRPQAYYERNPLLKRVVDALHDNTFCADDPGLFDWFYKAILEHGDYYFHLADLQSYIDTQEEAAQVYTNRAVWARKAILNVARIGKFSSDRTIQEYATDIWNISKV